MGFLLGQGILMVYPYHYLGDFDLFCRMRIPDTFELYVSVPDLSLAKSFTEDQIAFFADLAKLYGKTCGHIRMRLRHQGDL